MWFKDFPVRIVNSFLRLSRMRKRFVVLTIDLILIALAVAGAFYLRIGYWVFPTASQWLAYVVAMTVAPLIFVNLGLYNAVFRYPGRDAFSAILIGCSLYGLVYGVIFTVVGVSGVPRTIGIIQPLLLFVAIGFSRVAVWRVFSTGGRRGPLKNLDRKAVIYGAGSTGRQLANTMHSSGDMELLGYVDDDPTLLHGVIDGKKIISPSRLREYIVDHSVTDLLLAIPSATRRRRQEIISGLADTPVAVRILPALSALAEGSVTVRDLRELDIEDILGRDPVLPDGALMSKNITGKSVLVTGGGGSIGSELCRQIMQWCPAQLLILDSSEFSLYTIHQELTETQQQSKDISVEIIPLLASVNDQNRINAILAKWKPHTVYHAAAYKHVPLVEYNLVEGIRNNVIGTRNLALNAAKHGIVDFVLISTDKAVRPTNVMGASKRLAELILQAMSAQKGRTRYSMVRFGNVLGSSGSVVPLFRSQIEKSGTITLTHEDITRYFMTIPEAAQLVIQSGAMAKGGDVFVLEMGDPVKISDLARRMVQLSGLTIQDEQNPRGDIEIVVVGLRPGEKLYEELLIGNNPERTPHPRILKASEDFVAWPVLEAALNELERDIIRQDVKKVYDSLRKLVPEFDPQSPMADWTTIEP